MSKLLPRTSTTCMTVTSERATRAHLGRTAARWHQSGWRGTPHLVRAQPDGPRDDCPHHKHIRSFQNGASAAGKSGKLSRSLVGDIYVRIQRRRPTEAGLRTVLFGTPHPLADQHLGFIGQTADPFAALRVARVSDEITRPLAESMFVDALVGSGRAARVTKFRLGAAVRGVRRLVAGWQTARGYSNERATDRQIEGDVRL
jgi:hypothetical protein